MVLSLTIIACLVAELSPLIPPPDFAGLIPPPRTEGISDFDRSQEPRYIELSSQFAGSLSDRWPHVLSRAATPNDISNYLTLLGQFDFSLHNRDRGLSVTEACARVRVYREAYQYLGRAVARGVAAGRLPQIWLTVLEQQWQSLIRPYSEWFRRVA